MMEIRMTPGARDRFLKVFPRGIPEEIDLPFLNAALRRTGLFARTKCPGLYYEIALLEDHPRSCPYGCEDPTCRMLHGFTPEDVETLWNYSPETSYDELYKGPILPEGANLVPAHPRSLGVTNYHFNRKWVLAYGWPDAFIRPRRVIFPLYEIRPIFPLYEIADNPTLPLSQLRELES
ncbi:MAG: hypothetical protein Q8P59_11240, partial [Dehalococcoidia bacterium]|nr:hypothetical protein [Dehalococcoidia bacterium]